MGGKLPISSSSNFGFHINGKVPNHYHIVSTMANNQGNFVATNDVETIARANTPLGIGYRYWNGRGDSGAFVEDTSDFSGSVVTTVGKQIQAVGGKNYGVYASEATEVINAGYYTRYIIKY